MRSRSRSAAACFRCSAVAFALAIACSPTRALDPAQPFGSYISTHISMDEGLPGPIVDNLAQTPDGFLWMILTGNGRTSCDSRNFFLFEGTRVSTVAAAPNGDLWLGTRKDLKRLPAARLAGSDLSAADVYHPGEGDASNVQCIRFGRDG